MVPGTVQLFSTMHEAPTAVERDAARHLHDWFLALTEATPVLKQQFVHTLQWVLQDSEVASFCDVCVCVAGVEQEPGEGAVGVSSLCLYVWDGTGAASAGVPRVAPPAKYSKYGKD